MKKRFWTGIGSRYYINEIIKDLQERTGGTMMLKGWTLLTGGAKGSDYNFARGVVDHWDGAKELIPLKDYLHMVQSEKYPNVSGGHSLSYSLELIEDADFERAKEYFFKHNIFTKVQFNKMSEVAQCLHARNFFQIFDEHGKVRSEFVVYAAPEDRWGNISGGTRTAVAIARIEKLPTFNLKLEGRFDELQKFIEGLPDVKSC